MSSSIGDPPVAPMAESASDPLRSFRDPRLGITERFLTPVFDGVRTVAILSMPLGRPRALGWVLCQSYGPDQITLQGLEVPLARALSAAGFPVLRYHARGYGDSELTADHATFDMQLEDAVRAVELLCSNTGITRVGLTGIKIGATIAALTADHLSDGATPMSAIALWEPIAKGRVFTQSLLRLGLVTELVSRGRADGAPDPADTLHEHGVLDVQGFPVRADAVDQMSGINLTNDLVAFRGSSLVVQVSKSVAPRPDLKALTARLEELGGDARLEVLQHPQAHKLGRPRFKGLADGRKADTQAGLSTGLIETTIGWCESALGGHDDR
jgi:pimeloyl-ACP methyl ester carboxylesterase